MEPRTRARDVLSLLIHALGEARVEGLRLGESEPAIAAADGGECGVRVTIEAAVPYERIGDARTLVSRCLGAAGFVDVEELDAVPVAAARRYVVTLTIVAFDPLRTLRSNAAQSALDRAAPAEWYEAAGAAVKAAVEEFVTANPTWREALERRVLVSRMAVGGNEDEWEQLLKPLPEETRFAVEDARNLRELKRSHESAIGYVDEWLHKRNGNIGKRFVRGVWVPLLQSDGSPPRFGNGVDDLPEVGGVPPAVDLEAILARVEDTSLEEGDRLDALRELVRQGPEGASLGARALGHDALRLNALVSVDWKELQPLFREIAFARSGQRVFAALECMRGWKRTFRDPLEAWKLASGMPGNEYLGALYSGAILRDYARTGDRSAIPALIEALEDRTRPEEWRRKALQPLEQFEAAEAAPIVLRAALADDGDSDEPFDEERLGFGDESMSFFARVPYPPAKRLLVRGLKTSSLCSAFAATALRKLGGDAVAPLVAEADRIARTTFRGDTVWVTSTARALVREFGEIREETGALVVPEKTLRALGEKFPDLFDDVEDLLNPRPPVPMDAEESAVTGATPEETYDLRRARWLKPGYALTQYERSGHRGAWDSLIASAHERYNRTEEPGKDPTLRDEYAKALEMGCRDGIVAYRDAVVRVLGGEPVDETRFRNAGEWMPAQYPHSPYLSSAWVKVAEAAKRAGNFAAALDAARRAVDGVCHDPGARRILDDLESQSAAIEAAKSLPPLSVGTLVAAPSTWHDAVVTSLHLSEDGRLVLSADASGFVQVSHAIPADHYPAVIPDVREKLHDASSRARWIGPREFVSVGGDGAVCVVEWRPASPFTVRRIAAATPEARERSAQVPPRNPDALRDPDGNYEASLLAHGGIDVRGLREGLRGVASSGGSSGRFVLFDACFRHRMLVYATEHQRLGLTSWGN